MQTAISDFNHLAHARVLRQIQKFMCYSTVLPCFILNLRAISKYLPRAYIRRIDLTEGDFCVRSLGGLYIEGLIFGILRYLICTIPKISPGAYIFQRPFLSALFFEGLILQSEGLIYGGKFAFQNRLGYPYSWK